MNAAQLYADVRARLLSDNTATGMFPTGGVPLVKGVYNQYATEPQNFPFIVVDTIATVQNDAFAADIVNLEFTFSVFASKKPGSIELAQKIVNRIYGDAISQTGRTPTYGFHRHKMTTSWVNDDNYQHAWYYSHASRKSGFMQTEEDYYLFVETYKVMAYKDAESYLGL